MKACNCIECHGGGDTGETHARKHWTVEEEHQLSRIIGTHHPSVHALHRGSLDLGTFTERIDWKLVADTWNKANDRQLQPMTAQQLQSHYYNMLKKHGAGHL